MSNSNPPASEHKGWYSRGYLPHCDYPGLVQSIGFRLHDSVPADVIERWSQELKNVCESKRRDELCERIDRYADAGYGCCFLADSRVAELAENALLHFDTHRYYLLAWCVMSNHIHVLVVPQVGNPLSKILHSWKSYTSHHANKLLSRTGDFWFPDYYDEFMKSTPQMEDAILYIEFNPVTAKLVEQPDDWFFSSAAPRHRDLVQRNRLLFREVDPQQLPDHL